MENGRILIYCNRIATHIVGAGLWFVVADEFDEGDDDEAEEEGD